MEGVGSGRRGRFSTVAPVLLLVAAGLALAVRVVSIAEPLGIDQSLWASAVRGMSRGQLLYTDVWEQRPPGIYLSYWIAFGLFGWTSAAVAWLDLAASACAVVLLWAIGRRLDGPLAGALAAALYAVFTIPAGLHGYGGLLERAVCETFIIVAVAGAALCATSVRGRDSWLPAVAAGLCCGAAVVYKPNAGVYLPAILAWIVCYRFDAGERLRASWRLLLVSAVAAAVPSIAIVVWLWQNATIGDARTAVVDFNRWYVAAGFDPAAYALAFSKAVFLRMKTDPIWLAGTVASLAALWRLVRTRALPPLGGLALFWGAATVVVIVSNGARLFNTYFMQAFPPLCLMAAWAFVETRRTPGRTAVVWRYATVAAMAVVLVRNGYVPRVVAWTRADLAVLTGRMDPDAHLERFGGYANGRGYSARANQELADYIQAHTAPDDRIFLFGANGSGVYFLADRLSAHRFLRVNFFYPDDFPDPDFTLTTVTRELAERQPRYLIFEDLHTTSAIGRAVSGVVDDPRTLALLEDYEVEAVIEDFSVWRRVR